jgi:atypical dual specificity phosphatase
MNYGQVTHRLYVGSHPKGIEDIEMLEKILAIAVILNLQTDEDMAAAKLNWQLLESHYKTCAVSLHRMPMKEEQVILRQKLLSCVDRLDDLLAAGHTVHLRCTAGVGRSPTVAIAYLHRCLGWEMDAAIRYVKQVRIVHPI